MKENHISKILAVGILILFLGVCGNNIIIKVLSKNIREQESFLVDPPDEEWNYTFDRQGDDKGKCVIQTAEGGYIILCDKIDKIGDNRLNSDIWLIKTNEFGHEQWNRTYGGPNFDLGNQVQQTQDGGYIILGTIQIGSDSGDFWLIKTDSSGFVLWNRTFGGTGGDSGESVLQLSDGGYIIAGQKYVSQETNWDAWLIKTNDTGVEEWNHSYGGEQIDGICDIKETIDGGYILCGSTCSFVEPSHMWDPYDAWLIKTNSEGVEQWNHSYGTNHSYEWGFSVQQFSDGGFIVAGELLGDGKNSGILIRTDESGEEIWNRSYGGTYPKATTFFCINVTFDDDFIICGGNGYFDPQKGYFYDIWVLKIKSSGDILWEKTFGEHDHRDIGLSVAQTSLGGYIITGGIETEELEGSAAILIKLSTENQPPNPPSIDGPPNGRPGIEYTFCVTATDPEGDSLHAKFDWGDGTSSDWLGPFGSGIEVCDSHAWDKVGKFIIEVSVKDDYGATVTGTFEITIPRNRAITSSYWLRFLDMFPVLQRIIESIL